MPPTEVTTLTPPPLPAYLSDTHVLKPINGTPTGEDIKAIHAVIQSLSSVSHLPALHNPDLFMQLSQHLFGAQMAIYRSNYSADLPPRDENVYMPPTLPPHIPGILNRIAGAPSDEDIKSVQSVLRHVENLSNNPQLFDADLSMKLSQHLFNIQFARYTRDSTHGVLASGHQPGDTPAASQDGQELRGNLTGAKTSDSEKSFEVLSGIGRLEEVLKDIKESMNSGQGTLEKMLQVLTSGQGTHALADPNPAPVKPPEVLPGLTRMEKAVNDIKHTVKGSKDVLENMNRVLISTQRSQSTVGSFNNSILSTVHINPVNQQGILASECGLPQLRYWMSCKTNNYILWMGPKDIAGYLKFFNIGAHLLEGANESTLIDGKEVEAAKLLFKHIGIQYPNAKYTLV